MDLQKIENEALHLSKAERTKLIQTLVLSLEDSLDDELKSDWLMEAKRRGEDLDNGTVEAIPAHQVMEKARALLK